MPADKKHDYGGNPVCRRSPAFHAGAGKRPAYQRYYEDWTRDGFIETVSGKGSFVASQNMDFIREEQLRTAEELLQKAAEIGRAHGIGYERLAGILKMFYEE